VHGSKKAVIAREYEGSGTPQLHDSITDASEYWSPGRAGRPRLKVLPVVFNRHSSRKLAVGLLEFAVNLPPSPIRDAGNAGRSMRPIATANDAETRRANHLSFAARNELKSGNELSALPP
jgi:hypothetical protein